MAEDMRTEVANYLLNHCFLMGSVEETRTQYYYVQNHLEEFNTLFRALGYTVVLHTSPLKVVALVNNREGNQARLLKYESILLLILRLLYLQKREKLTVDGDQVVATVEEIQTEYQKMNLNRKLDQRTLESLMRTLKRYNLARPLDSLGELSARIEIFPSVIVALPDNVLNASCKQTEEALAKYQKSGPDEEELE